MENVARIIFNKVLVAYSPYRQPFEVNSAQYLIGRI